MEWGFSSKFYFLLAVRRGTDDNGHQFGTRVNTANVLRRKRIQPTPVFGTTIVLLVYWEKHIFVLRIAQKERRVNSLLRKISRARRSFAELSDWSKNYQAKFFLKNCNTRMIDLVCFVTFQDMLQKPLKIRFFIYRKTSGTFVYLPFAVNITCGTRKKYIFFKNRN